MDSFTDMSFVDSPLNHVRCLGHVSMTTPSIKTTPVATSVPTVRRVRHPWNFDFHYH